MVDVAIVFLCCIAIAGCLLLVTMQQAKPVRPLKKAPLVHAVSMRAMENIASGTPVYRGDRASGRRVGVVANARLEKGVLVGDIVMDGQVEWEAVRIK